MAKRKTIGGIAQLLASKRGPFKKSINTPTIYIGIPSWVKPHGAAEYRGIWLVHKTALIEASAMRSVLAQIEEQCSGKAKRLAARALKSWEERS